MLYANYLEYLPKIWFNSSDKNVRKTFNTMFLKPHQNIRKCHTKQRRSSNSNVSSMAKKKTQQKLHNWEPREMPSLASYWSTQCTVNQYLQPTLRYGTTMSYSATQTLMAGYNGVWQDTMAYGKIQWRTAQHKGVWQHTVVMARPNDVGHDIAYDTPYIWHIHSCIKLWTKPVL